MNSAAPDSPPPSRLGLKIPTLLTVSMAAVIVLTITMLTVVDVQRQQRIFHAQLAEKGVWLARTLNDVFADALYFRDVERLRHLSEVAAAQPEVLSVTVFDKDGRILVATMEDRFPSGYVSPAYLSYVNRTEPTILDLENEFQAIGPIRAGPGLLGGVNVVFDVDPIHAQIRETVIDHVWQGGLVMLLGIALSWGVAQWLVRGVRELVDVTKRVGEGDFSTGMAARRSDELGELGQALEEMSSRLREVEEERTRQQEALNDAAEKIRGEASNRKRAQLGRQEMAEHLNQTLESLEDAHARMKRLERTASLGQIAGGVAHDVGNLLQVVLGATSPLLLDPRRMESTSDVKKSLENVEAAVANAARVLDRLRDFQSRNEEPLTESVVDLREIIEETIQLAEPYWRSAPLLRGIEIRLNQKLAIIPRTSANRVEFEQLVLNLLFNAVESMPRGGTINVRLDHDGKRIRLEIEDDGVGMSEEVRANCLEPFYSTRSEEGAGLGLSLVAEVVERYDGTISVESEEGRGTKVTVEFPARHTRGVATVDRKTDTPPKPMTILCVDDDELVRTSLVAYLRYDSHTVDLAASGAEALRKFDPGRHDIVICNRAMPGMSGDEVARRIFEASHDVPVIIVTGMGAGHAVLRDKPPGVDMVLTKPITLAALRVALSEVSIGRLGG